MPFLAEVKSIFNNLISFRSPHKKSHSGSKRKRDEIIADAEVDQPAAQSLVPPGLDSDQQLTHFFGPSSNANKATLQPYSSSAPGVISQPAISAFNLSSDVLPHSNYQFKNFQPPGSVLSDRAPPSGMKGEDYKFHRRMHTKGSAKTQVWPGQEPQHHQRSDNLNVLSRETYIEEIVLIRKGVECNQELEKARETNLKVPARITEIDLTSTQYDETAAPAAAGQHSQMPIANAAGLELTQQLPQERWTAPQGVHSRLSPPLSKAFAKIFDGINPDGEYCDVREQGKQAMRKADETRKGALLAAKKPLGASASDKEEMLKAELTNIEAKLKTIQLIRTKGPIAQKLPLAATDQETSTYEKAILEKNPSKILACHPLTQMEVRGKDMATMAAGEWLNDEIINVYMAMLQERDGKYRAENSDMPKCHFFNTFFANKLYKDGGYNYKDVRRWTMPKKLASVGQKCTSILDCDYIILPVHQGVHWVCAVIDLRNKKFVYLDSLKGQDSMCLQNLARYLQDEYKDKRDEMREDVMEWPREFPTDIPTQKNGCDCGVFTIIFAEHVSRNASMTFTQENMQYYRVKVVNDIMKTKID